MFKHTKRSVSLYQHMSELKEHFVDGFYENYMSVYLNLKLRLLTGSQKQLFFFLEQRAVSSGKASNTALQHCSLQPLLLRFFKILQKVLPKLLTTCSCFLDLILREDFVFSFFHFQYATSDMQLQDCKQVLHCNFFKKQSDLVKSVFFLQNHG